MLVTILLLHCGLLAMAYRSVYRPRRRLYRLTTRVKRYQHTYRWGRLKSKNASTKRWKRTYPKWNTRRNQSLTIKDVSPDKAMRSDLNQTLQIESDCSGLVFMQGAFIGAQIFAESMGKWREILITGGRCVVNVSWETEKSMGGNDYSFNASEKVDIEVYILWRKDVLETNDIEQLPKSGFGNAYSPYDVGRIGRHYTIQKKKYNFILSHAVDGTRDREDYNIILPIKNYRYNTAKALNFVHMPYIFVMARNYRQAKTNDMSQKWSNVIIKASTIFHYRGTVRED